MEDVRIYDFEFNLLHVEHNISSCNWSFYENDIGSFEMHFDVGSNLVKVVAENRYLVAVQGRKQAIITGKKISEEGILFGKSCNWILTRFCLAEEFNTDELLANRKIAATDVQTVCSYLIQEGLGDVSNFVFSRDDDSSFGDVFLENKSVRNLFDLIQDCAKQVNCGHQVYFDLQSKQWVFSLVAGKTLPFALSEDNRNAYETEYTSDLQNLFVGGYYEQEMTDKGDWDIFNNKPRLADNDVRNYALGYKVVLDKESTGYSEFKRFGISFFDGDYIVCTTPDGVWKKATEIKNFMALLPPSASGIYGWKTKLDGVGETEAIKSLTSFCEKRSVVQKTTNFRFGEDYQLGDVIMQKVMKGSFQASVMRKITGVHLWYEANNVGEQPIFEEEFN